MDITDSKRQKSDSYREHSENYKKQKPDSFLNNHQAEKHNGSEANFNFKVLKSFKDPMSRQIYEGVQIRRATGEVLNSKMEYNRCAIPRLTAKLGRAEASRQEHEEQQQEKELEAKVQDEIRRRRKENEK